MMKKIFILAALVSLFFSHESLAETADKYHYIPPFLTNGSPPLVMLTMSKDHRLYHAAYNDASDIDGDGKIDIRYNPTIDYYGYFDSYKYYVYRNNRFEPEGHAPDKKVPSTGYWSGNFLNYATMTRMDCIRKVLYGGYRIVDTKTTTVLRRAYVPEDAHSFGKEYTSLSVDGYKISDYTPYSEPKNNQRIFFASTTLTQDGHPVLRVALNRPSNQRIWGWVAKASPVAKNIVTNENKQDVTISSGDLKDFTVDVLVCDSRFPEINAKQYPDGNYKPVGILQRYGESNQMEFGLLTGSYENNMAGGVLRKNIGPINDEIDQDTGQFKWKTNNSYRSGIIYTIDQFKIVDYQYDKTAYGGGWSDAWLVDKPMSESSKKFPDWGNPLAEMIYETARYFAGKMSPTSQFTYGTSSNIFDNKLGLPKPSWGNPYNDENYCAQPIMVAISDIFPSYDSDHLPGSVWSKTVSNPLSNLNVENELRKISQGENISGNTFIGQAGTNYDDACTPKDISGLHNIRGLCQEEPTKQGSYYSAAVTHFAHQNDLNAVEDDQKMLSYMVALSSPLPEITIPVGNKEIKIIPFGKTVKTHTPVAITNPNTAPFLPTCSIAGFFVDFITEDQKKGRFRVNFEDVEQGADYDMDVILLYEYEVVNSNNVKITVTQEHVAAGYVLHLGYIVSGSTKDGVYLELACSDAGFQDVLYKLDTPPGVGPGRPQGNTTQLPRDIATRTFSPSATPAAQLLENPLWYAAKWGGFEDINGNGIPDLQEEWDRDANGVPDTYFYVANPTKLEEQLNKAFSDILRRTTSGTSISNVPQGRDGEGAIYQSVFFPEMKDGYGNTIHWAGQAHALFRDGEGNIREDSNQNGMLDLKEDQVIEFTESAVYRFQDVNGDGTLSDAERNATITTINDMQSINYIWNTSSWLNDSELNLGQRSYTSKDKKRYIFTFVDTNENMICDNDNELQDFVWPGGSPNLRDTSKFYSYLTLYPSFEDTPEEIATLRSQNPTQFSSLIRKLAQRQINFIRGEDSLATIDSGVTIPATRSRTIRQDNQLHTWRLGDIVYSSPALAGKPAENYDLVYKDKTYAEFYKKYKDRRQVVYVGANDGMLHAFNAGFFNAKTKSFDLSLAGNETDFPLGMELWAYVPYNLLPHLLWLTDPNYGEALHVSYMDLKPRIFDARIFPNDEDHPYGWGTVLVAGMRFGGGKIKADIGKAASFDPNRDRYLNSSYVVMDITNPEKPPKLLAEIAMPRQGFTTCYPTVMSMCERGATTEVGASFENQWYLVFGSGPADSNGYPPAPIRHDSDQNGRLFVVDLNALATSKQLLTLAAGGEFTGNKDYFALTETASFVSDIIASDFDLDFKTNAVYYGTISRKESRDSGTLRRLVTLNSPETENWMGSKILFTADQPIAAAPAISRDEKRNIWLYFGTGRYFDRGDVTQIIGMSFYGVKEPLSNSADHTSWTWGEVLRSSLYDSTEVALSGESCTTEFTRDCVVVKKSGSEIMGGWNTLLSDVSVKSGWMVNFSDEEERVLEQAVVRGGSVFFSSYKPSLNLCEFEGSSKLWALYYLTGTPYYKPILGVNIDGGFMPSIDLGRGMASKPSVVLGEYGGKVYVQTSDGRITKIDVDIPLPNISGPLFWREIFGE